MIEKKILITGSTKGIGKGIAQKFQENGWQVCLNGRNAMEVEQKVEQLNSIRKNSAIGIASDLSQIKEVNRVKNYILKQWGYLDSIVLNIGSGRGTTGIHSSFDENKNLLEVNYINPVKNFNVFLNLFKNNSPKSVIFIGSIAQETNVGAPMTYSYAKKALNVFAKSQALKQSINQISINVINPGHIYTDNSRWKRNREDSSAELENYVSKNIPVGRIGETEDVSQIIFNILENNHGSFLTGASLTIDGGTSLLS